MFIVGTLLYSDCLKIGCPEALISTKWEAPCKDFICHLYGWEWVNNQTLTLVGNGRSLNRVLIKLSSQEGSTSIDQRTQAADDITCLISWTQWLQSFCLIGDSV